MFQLCAKIRKFKHICRNIIPVVGNINFFEKHIVYTSDNQIYTKSIAVKIVADINARIACKSIILCQKCKQITIVEYD